MAVKSKWARGITPRNFCWVIKDRLAVCERPGGYGQNHRRVRRQEEIIWIREQGFTKVVSLVSSPANLHNYDELGVEWVHRPFTALDDSHEFERSFFPELRGLLAGDGKVLVHQEELGDRISGLMGGYLLWAGLLDSGPQTISVVERIVDRQMGPLGRELVALAGQLRDEP
ncbi:MAG: hypothetical protein KDB10_01060 [Acidimicrobiales bacterium]|nr:hypothetical protein [Acidimicrobiales bacterium]MCB9371717.1 hypothetical protein [Microthrixaceae bacterium]